MPQPLGALSAQAAKQGTEPRVLEAIPDGSRKLEPRAPLKAALDDTVSGPHGFHRGGKEVAWV